MGMGGGGLSKVRGMDEDVGLVDWVKGREDGECGRFAGGGRAEE